MAIKKSELYSSLWASCDELRGGMDPSQYKDYVLVLLFVKYVSDKYANDPDAIIEIPEGGSFKDMIALKHQKDIGDKINTIIGELAKANDLVGVIDVADFNDDEKLGKGKEMVDKLTNLISIFQNPALDFSKNRAEGDDILGDAFEYLMKNFATESGKSKGQFYTPSEVSRVIAKVLSIHNATNKTTFYDPTCGSGSLLLKAVDEADGKGTIYGQEKDVATAALARMNMILHGQEAIEIHRGQSTLSDPFFKDSNGYLKTFDFVVANPPFSSKNWATGFNPQDDLFGRFEKDEEETKKTGKASYKTPPDKNGDYAFLLHIIKSLKSTGKGACILPHGVLFRGNAESEIRKSLIQRGYIKGIIGLPGNLFYGTGIPACIIVIDKEGAADRKHIFMMDAGKGYIKDGNKNRLREQDIHKIVDVFNKQIPVPGFSRLVGIDEISDPKNDFNLNIPRYIDSQEAEDIQDIEAHLLGDIPNADIEALKEYWEVYKTLKGELFSPSKRKNYSQLKISKDSIKQTIFNHPEFVSFSSEMDTLFADWKTRNTKTLKALTIGIKPKQTIYKVSEDVLKAYTDKALMNKYDVYQHLMNYWNEVMQDDCYLIAADGWKAELSIIKQTKSATVWDCDLVPKTLVIDRYFLTEKKAIEQLEADKEGISVQLTELEENLPDNVEEDDWILNEVKNAKGKITKGLVEEKMKELKIEILKIPASKTKKEVTKIIKDSFEKTKRSDANAEAFVKLDVLQSYLDIVAKDAELKDKIRKAIADLDIKVIERYNSLTEVEIKQLVVDDKWMANIDRRIKTEFKNITQNLTDRIKVLYERYKVTLSEIRIKDNELETNVDSNFEKMGLKIHDILAGKERIPGFTKKWKPVVVADLGNTFGGLSGKSKVDFQKGQFPYIPFLNIMNNPVIDTEFLDYVNINPDEKQNKALKGDLFFNGSSETPEEVGMCSVLLEDIPNLYLNSFCFGFRLFNPTEVNGIYLSYFFRSKAGRRLFYSLAQGATRYNLSKSNFNKIEFELPDIDEQNAIAKTVADINNQITAMINKLEKYKMIKEGMMQNLLTGKIRL